VLVGDPTVGTDVYRIAQEAVTNSIKHGQARRIEIELAATGEGGVLTVTDDGLGLSGKADGSSGLGLRIMQYRADTMGGSVSIQPTAGGGTRILCTFPLSFLQMTTPART
jgi:signal transduction histidine kinase